MTDELVIEEEAVTPETLQAILAAIAAGAEVLRARPPVRLGDWAAEHFYLSPEGSHASGEWRAWPFQIAILDWMGDDAIEELDIQKSKRVGYTKMLLARMAFSAVHLRRKLALWQPTDDDRDSFVKSEVEPMLRDVRSLRAVIPPGAANDTIKLKQFIGSVWHLLGGKAARAYRRITVADALLDEIDGFDQVVEKSSDPFTLARGRLEGAPFPKLIAGSTPRVEGLSHIARRRKQATAQMEFRIVCPHCGVDHPLLWTDNGDFGLVWDAEEVGTVRHVCPHCREPITQADYFGLWKAGEWVDAKERYRYGVYREWRNAAGMPCEAPRHVGVHVWSAYSPQRSWESIAREFIEACEAEAVGDSGPMQGFRNETLGETWENTGHKADENELRRRLEDIPLRVVVYGCVLTLGVDVQKDRVEARLYSWARGMERQLVDRALFYGDPTLAETDKGSPWRAFTEYRRTPVLTAAGAAVPLLATMIDSSDGHTTQAVYVYCREHQAENVLAIKGSSQPGRAIVGAPRLQEVNWRGVRIKRGVKLWALGVDTAKAEIYGRLRVLTPGPGYVHLSKHLPADEIDQITSERLVSSIGRNGKRRLEWVLPRGRRNEGLDCAVYALAAAHWVGIDRWKDGDWQRREEAVRVEQPEQKAGAKREHMVAAGVSRRISVDGMARFGDRPNAQR